MTADTLRKGYREGHLSFVGAVRILVWELQIAACQLQADGGEYRTAEV